MLLYVRYSVRYHVRYSIYQKTLENHAKRIYLKYLCQRRMINLNYLMDQIPYRIFKAILSISSKNTEQ